MLALLHQQSSREPHREAAASELEVGDQILARTPCVDGRDA
jgi:hypothetical protein